MFVHMHYTACMLNPILLFKKCRLLWPLMMDSTIMTGHQHTQEGNLLKPTKMCSLKNRLVTELFEETYFYKIEKP